MCALDIEGRWACLEILLLCCTFALGVSFFATWEPPLFFVGMFVSSTHGALRLWSSHRHRTVCVGLGAVRLGASLFLIVPSFFLLSIQGEADAAIVVMGGFTYCLACLLPEVYLAMETRRNLRDAEGARA